MFLHLPHLCTRVRPFKKKSDPTLNVREQQAIKNQLVTTKRRPSLTDGLDSPRVLGSSKQLTETQRQAESYDALARVVAEASADPTRTAVEVRGVPMMRHRENW